MLVRSLSGQSVQEIGSPGAAKAPHAEPIAISSTSRRLSIVETGAVADGTTINTVAIQAAFDRLAATGGGTVVVPGGVFLSGALFLKPGVHLHLEKNAVLKCTTDMAHFPPRPTRIEGRNQEFTPALLNADGCDGLRITGEGTLDGDGRKIWDQFWTRRNADKTTRNLDVARARLAHISHSRDVRVSGITFKDSQFWNLHFYDCRDVVVEGARFLVPDDYKQAPSTDGIDVDSSQDVVIRGCTFSVTDDCVALKGAKGPLALEDVLSPPVERVLVTDCTFKRGSAAVTLGSEATAVRDIVLEKSRVSGAMLVLHVKLRPDTPQHYENVEVRDLLLDNAGGRLISMKPWRQYFDLQGHPPPKSIVRKINFTRVTGRYGGIGGLEGNPGQTTIDGISFSEMDLALGETGFRNREGKNVSFENVRINGVPFSP